MDQEANIVSPSFITDVAKYFMDFLETDFKKRQQPKRNLTTRVNKGHTIGLYLDPYPDLYKILYKNFIAGFPQSIKIQPEQYLAKAQTNSSTIQIEDKTLQGLIKTIVMGAYETKWDSSEDFSRFYETTTDLIRAKLADFVESLLKQSSKKDNLEQLNTDITDKIYHLAEEILPNILEAFFKAIDREAFYILYENLQVDRSDLSDLSTALGSLFNTQSIQEILDESLEIIPRDAYSEILQLNRNKDMLDKTELYLYFGEIGIEDYSFPLFYTPISVAREKSTLEITFDSLVFVNIKAIEFIVQKYNELTNRKESVAGCFNRIIYVEEEQNLLPQLEDVINQCRETLGINQTIELSNLAIQKIKNTVNVSISNHLQLFLFDKADEALLNDYEEIINNEGLLTESFTDLIGSFITKNPANVIEEVNQEWQKRTTQDKLIINSPIALNEEQKQALIALQKPDCRVTIVEGPPGTGKSYTITAIICKALLENQSVLVLSDKEEALDVVQDKITDTLKNTHDGVFQNPILRLGKTSKNLAKILQSQSIEILRTQLQTFRSQETEFTHREEATLTWAKSILKQTI
ncbi:AAA domain-containing protein [Candidatus Nitrosacidococcus sp. I8]|uniref:AAA domain-containing protein n=1 Tax=Candidatus Nitrosacidococcus sp. I8 TaxID=2942908 RepID=UPI0022277944|nr:AAA domain-containing protein [Candidatus Nitrosacidococcus sp. I8]CAH9018636.1 hypothetical protein NURINAE_01043 [Candidatus Nitrosacidococcus sp. I8]